jgi:hypothetical protein
VPNDLAVFPHFRWVECHQSTKPLTGNVLVLRNQAATRTGMAPDKVIWGYVCLPAAGTNTVPFFAASTMGGWHLIQGCKSAEGLTRLDDGYIVFLIHFNAFQTQNTLMR